MTYDGGERITGTTIEPSNTTPIGTKTIEITNDGTESVYYVLHWKELYNELVNVNTTQYYTSLKAKYEALVEELDFSYDDLVSIKEYDPTLTDEIIVQDGLMTQDELDTYYEYHNASIGGNELYITATCTSYSNYGKSNQTVSGTCEGFTKDIPTQSTLYTYNSGKVNSTYKLTKNVSIASGITNVYNVSVYFRNEDYSQNYNQNKQFYGSIGVIEGTAPLITIRSSLSEYSWNEIKTLSNALVSGVIDESDLLDYNIKIGDTTASVSITTTGGYDDYAKLITTSNTESHTFRLVGINHDVDASGNTLGMTFEQTDLMNNYYVMKSSMTSSDSWDNSDLKTTINNFILPSDLNSVITSAKKPCVTSVTNSTLTYVTSKLWVMSETEIAGT